MPDPRTGAAFTLARGYSRGGSPPEREGFMRPATARDEARALADFRVHLGPERILPVVLARVVTRLGALERREIDAGLFESLEDEDLRALEALYRALNGYEPAADEEAAP
jgi:hypothetical protein